MDAASNPAQIRLQLAHFLKCDLKDLLILAGTLLLGGALLFFDWRASLLAVGIGIIAVVISIHQTKQMFAEGDVCPALVINAKRGLVAVATDLSRGGKPYPVVKVLKQPLSRVAGGPFADQTRLAFVAMYNGFANEPRWRNFGGHLINTGTADEKTIRRTLRSIDDEQWEWLEAALEQLDEPYQPGLYEKLDV